MVRINYNQKETKRRPWCFNYFSHIIWFCGGKPGPAKKRKDEKQLKLHGEKVQRLFTHGPSILYNCRQDWWLAPKPCCKLSMERELRCSHAGFKLFRMAMTSKEGAETGWLQTDKNGRTVSPKKKKKKRLLWHTWFLSIQICSNIFTVAAFNYLSSKIPLNSVILIICHAILPSGWGYALCLATGESWDEAWVRCSMNLLHSRPLFAESLLTRWCCHSAKLHSCSTICGGVNYPNVSGSSSVPH